LSLIFPLFSSLLHPDGCCLLYLASAIFWTACTHTTNSALWRQEGGTHFYTKSLALPEKKQQKNLRRMTLNKKGAALTNRRAAHPSSIFVCVF
jgi:hypothetical protein